MRALLHLLTAVCLLAQASVLAPPVMAAAMSLSAAHGMDGAHAMPSMARDCPHAMASARQAATEGPHHAGYDEHVAMPAGSTQNSDCCGADCPCPMACAAFAGLPMRTVSAALPAAQSLRGALIPGTARYLPPTLLRPPISS